MKVSAIVTTILLFSLAGCAASGGFPSQTLETAKLVPADKRIEISLTPETYEVGEVEFHVDATCIPPEIRESARKLIPEGWIGDCEIEYHGGKIFYEVTCTVRGQEQEIMFTSDGAVHSWEVEIDKKDVPHKVLDAAFSAIPEARLEKAEEIRDGDFNLLEYHFKLVKDWLKYKAVVTVDGELLQLFRETTGEIEVPLL